MGKFTILVLVAISLPLYLQYAGAIKKPKNRTLKDSEMKISFVSGLKMLYEVKKNESLSKENLKALNEQLEDRGALEFLKGLKSTNFTLETREKNETYFIVSMRIKNGSIKDVFFGEYPKAGKNIRNPYISVEVQFIERILDKWQKETESGKKEPGVGLVFSTIYNVLKGIFQGKLRLKPFWSILRAGKLLGFSSALRSADLNTSIVPG